MTGPVAIFIMMMMMMVMMMMTEIKFMSTLYLYSQ